MKSKKNLPETGHVYAVPLLNGKYGIVHLCLVNKFGRKSFSITAGFFNHSFQTIAEISDNLKQIDLSNPFLVVSITSSVILEGEWILVGSQSAQYTGIDWAEKIKGQLKLYNGFEIDPDWILDMYHGNYPWDGFYDPLYLDKMLIPGKSRPSSAKMRSAFSAEELKNLGV